VCPEHIKITDNAIIPLKERVADRYYDPIQVFWRKLTGRGGDETAPSSRTASSDGQTASPDGRTTDQPGRGA
jgi:hypothetical protein